MSTQKDNFNSLFSDRLKAERERLSFSQAQAADICGVSREMWGKYERGISVPGGEVLFSFAASGADVNYILGGTKKHHINEEYPAYLRPDQIALLDNLDHCSPEDQAAIKRLALLAAAAADTTETQPQDEPAPHHQQTG